MTHQFKIEKIPLTHSTVNRLEGWTITLGRHRSYVDRRIISVRVRYLKRNKTLVTCIRALKKVSKKKRLTILEELDSMFGVKGNCSSPHTH